MNVTSKHKTIRRGGCNDNLIQDTNRIDVGEGLFLEDIALRLGVLNLTNDNPNKSVVKLVVEGILKLKPSGHVRTEVWNQMSSGGGVGFHGHTKYKYSEKDLNLVKMEIKKHMTKVIDGIYIVRKKKFRVNDSF
jgi:hypothetical protein